LRVGRGSKGNLHGPPHPRRAREVRGHVWCLAVARLALDSERLVEFYMLARHRAGPLVGMGASVVAHAMFCSPASVVAWREAALAGVAVRAHCLAVHVHCFAVHAHCLAVHAHCLAVTAACLQARRTRQPEPTKPPMAPNGPQPWQAANPRADRSWPQYGSTSGSIPSSKVSCASRWGRIRVVDVAKRVAFWRYCASGSSSPLAAPLSKVDVARVGESPTDQGMHEVEIVVVRKQHVCNLAVDELPGVSVSVVCLS
jgi:hypothetical protein